MKIITNSRFVPKGYTGITLYPFILLRYDAKHYGPQKYANLLTHESIHLQQQKEMIVVLFYIVYAIHYIINLVKYGNKNKAYRNIVFEKEAFTNEANKNYLDSRRFWAWLGYF
ncbi:MAG: hypothetical protein B6I20_07775 [Bacteroidetes bacterium 4572_117]|nr:MAG: hypothetical protein B6I20_07775 [Bacteroidetes bacterium 4572_117]